MENSKSNKRKPTITATEINIAIANRNTLVAHIEHIIKVGQHGISYKHDPTNNDSFFIALKRKDCGCEYNFKEAKDIPSTSLICKHGNQIIRYTDEEILN